MAMSFPSIHEPGDGDGHARIWAGRLGAAMPEFWGCLRIPVGHTEPAQSSGKADPARQPSTPAMLGGSCSSGIPGRPCLGCQKRLACLACRAHRDTPGHRAHRDRCGLAGRKKRHWCGMLPCPLLTTNGRFGEREDFAGVPGWACRAKPQPLSVQDNVNKSALPRPRPRCRCRRGCGLD